MLKNKNIIANIFVILSTGFFGAVLLYILYRWQMLESVPRVSGATVCVVFLIFALAALLSKFEFKLMYLSTAITLFVWMGGYQLFLYETSVWANDPLQDFQEAKSQNADLHYNINYEVTEHYVDSMDLEFPPLASVPNVQTFYCDEGYGYIQYKSDRYGFNNPDSRWEINHIDTLFIGDSFTQGSCVPRENNAVEVYAKNSQRPTLNLGVAGFYPVHELAVFKEYGNPLKPQKVVWVYYEGNDLQEHKQTKHILQYLEKDAPLKGYLGHQKDVEQSALKIEQQYLNDVHSKRANPIAVNLRFTNLRERLRLVPAVDSAKVDPAATKVLADILKQVKTSLSVYGGKLYFVYLPSQSRFSLGQDVSGMDFQKKEIVDFLKKESIPLIDFTTVLKKKLEPKSSYTHRYGHFTKEVYNELGIFISDSIVGENPASSENPERIR